MPDEHIRRHTLYASDKEILLFERALQVYAQVMSIRLANNPHHDQEATERVTAIVQAHHLCKCPGAL